MKSCPNCGHQLGFISFGGVTLNEREGTIAGLPHVYFSPGEVKVLITLMEAKGEPVSRKQCSLACAKYAAFHEDKKVVDVYIHRIRQKFASKSLFPIETIRKVGYRFRPVRAP